MKTHFFILVMLALASSAQAADVKTPAPADTCKFSIHAGKINQIFSCAASVGAYEIDDGIVHADLLHGADRYLLIEHSYISNQRNPNGHCGAGLEGYLVWLHVRDSGVIAAQSAHILSCWEDIEGGGSSVCSPQSCTFEYFRSTYDPQAQHANTTSYRAAFDFNAPEKGLQIAGPTTE
ncbi:hypothetical protein ELE36_18480 [Pseudolysobacter antarcticus]|uniref:DUF3757 domain-containing protein n=1 Tax=Pseudolysobacter antarcticus TaxID=2511995 RepID=A0A411HNY0_9GAMM|nr:hypothetical protein [Pseudolysobacter antarcticus]QBB72191.1 hypothetical protein ELE36_18480 [Pseudolysobacter antarcticus]